MRIGKFDKEKVIRRERKILYFISLKDFEEEGEKRKERDEKRKSNRETVF